MNRWQRNVPNDIVLVNEVSNFFVQLGIHKSTSRSKILAYVFFGNLKVVTKFSEKCINVIRYQAKGPEILIYEVKISVEIQKRIPYGNVKYKLIILCLVLFDKT